MSEQDRNDWNDDMDFEVDGEVQEEFDDFDDPLEGFDDFDDMTSYEDLADEDTPVMEAEDSQDGVESEASDMIQENLVEKIPVDPAAAAALKKQKRRRGLSAIGMGFLFTASILVAGVGMGGAILLAEGVSPKSLWQPQNLMQIDQLLNFADHPLNVFYMVSMGIVFLALLGSYKMSKAAIQANERTREAEDMLDRLTSLNMEKEEEWQSQEFAEYPPAEAFVIRTLGAWRLQKARQKRLMGVEGELHRLEKALSTNSRDDLTGRFDHPAVGRLADEMIRYFDARDTAVNKLSDYQNKDRESGKDFLGTLQESRLWNLASLDQLGVQCTALDDLTKQMNNLAEHVEQAVAASGSTEGMTDIIEAIRQDIASPATGGMAAEQMATELNDLVDRGSKLAFKIAMEVARLGPRGERLLPMSQSLEDLTTGFRQLTDRVNDRSGSGAVAQAQMSVLKKLETLAALITQDDRGPWRDVAEEIPDYGPATAGISSVLNEMTQGFNEQEDRLVQLGKTNAELTGAEFDSNSIPRKDSSEAPVAMLNFERPSFPSKPRTPVEKAAPKDPFATADSLLLSPTEGSSDPDFSSSVLPGQDGLATPKENFPQLELEDSGGFSLTPDSAPDMPLSDDEEKVYDLEDFGASPAEVPGSEDTEQTYDLSAFGAVPVTDDDSRNSDEVYELSDFDPVALTDDHSGQEPEPAETEDVYELSDFGASPLAAATPETEEDVYDLSEFDASPLEQAAGPGLDDAEIQDEVYDLSEFGAKPMK